MDKFHSKRPILTLTVIAAAVVAGFRAIGADGNYAPAGQHMLGVSDCPGTVGNELAVDVIGTTDCTASAAIAVDALLEVAAEGKFVTRTTGKVVGRALTAATGDGDIFEALLLPANS